MNKELLYLIVGIFIGFQLGVFSNESYLSDYGCKTQCRCKTIL